jgi:hypothetical protein
MLIRVILTLLVCVSASAAEQKFTGFRMSFCEDETNKSCLVLEAGKADQTYFSHKLLLRNNVTLKLIDETTIKFSGAEGYYDPLKDVVVIKGVKDRKFTEMAFYVKERRIIVM